MATVGESRLQVPKDDAFIVRNSKINPPKSSYEFSKDLLSASVSTHDSTVPSRLLEHNWIARRPIKLLPVVTKHIYMSQETQTFDGRVLEKLMFSEESHFFEQGMKVQYIR